MKAIVMAIASLIAYLVILTLVTVLILLCISKSFKNTSEACFNHRTQSTMAMATPCGVQYQHYMWYNPSNYHFGYQIVGEGLPLIGRPVNYGPPYMPKIPVDKERLTAKSVSFLDDPDAYHFPIDPLSLDQEVTMEFAREALRFKLNRMFEEIVVDESFNDFAMGRCAGLDIIGTVA